MVSWCPALIGFSMDEFVTYQRGTGESGMSTATTVPASSDSVRKSLGGAASSSTSPKTPSVRIKRSNTAPVESEELSAPKELKAKSRKKEVRRSPTVHYSPEKAEEPSVQATSAPPTRLTAVKAKAKKSPRKGRVQPVAKAKASPKKGVKGAVKAKGAAKKPAGQSETPEVEPKVETPDRTSAEAVKSALNRKTTVEISGNNGKGANCANPSTPAESDASCSQSDQSASASEDEDEEVDAEGPDGSDGLTVEQVKARKAAHARYMRFSRSFKKRGNSAA